MMADKVQEQPETGGKELSDKRPKADEQDTDGKKISDLRTKSDEVKEQEGSGGKNLSDKRPKKRKQEEVAGSSETGKDGSNAKELKVKAPSLLVFGLGNASDASRQERHSLGARVLDTVVSRSASKALDEKPGAIGVRSLDNPDRPWLTLPPQGSINDSGVALKEALTALEHVSASFLVVVDDCSLPLGTIRLRAKGSTGGHNGLKSIEAVFGTGYHRLKLGIGGSPSREHVVGAFDAKEHALVSLAIDRAVEAVKLWLSQGPEEIQMLMSKVNNPDFCHVKMAASNELPEVKHVEPSVAKEGADVKDTN